ncbi:hypothetical protein N865_11790 [Intrasporangium oryzae NRRL B-24470]|uniref:Lipoprotein n=1 Tax=Intrasporangium oryzae NRRL B-24470 TaxID=1386089 RepID=W9G518_9MICO|nr:hypothetical protein [Intrasporangium oryzae]EWT01100.1 hypothetical protein N865_11790 [Intrasporangium oryzae NRRL B-24470]
MAGRWARGAIAALAVMGAALVLPSGDAAAEHSRAMVVAAAHAGPGTPDDSDTQTLWSQVGRGGRATATATASSTCDGCSGRADAVEVVRAHGGVTAENVAAAWSTCVDCSARAVSVQVVLVAQDGPVTATNRALAVNAACTRCSTEAVAVQLVLVGARPEGLPASARKLLDDLVATLGADPAPSSSARSARPGGTNEPAVAATARELQNAAGAASVTIHVDRKTGST